MHPIDFERMDGIENTPAAKHANDALWYLAGFAAIFAFGWFIAEFAMDVVK